MVTASVSIRMDGIWLTSSPVTHEQAPEEPAQACEGSPQALIPTGYQLLQTALVVPWAQEPDSRGSLLLGIPNSHWFIKED